MTSFALFLDDIPEELRHAPDREAFGSLVEAQLAVVNAVASRLAQTVTVDEFAVCPTLYWGRGDEPYIADLGRGLADGIRLYWTGRAICSPHLESSDAEVFFDAAGRKPLYWDNFPVNDVAMTGELHIGPYLGRDADLGEHADGIIANAMPLAEASKIALASIADYVRDPHGFDRRGELGGRHRADSRPTGRGGAARVCRRVPRLSAVHGRRAPAHGAHGSLCV